MKKSVLAAILVISSLIPFGGKAVAFEQGDRSDAVLELQHRLAELGYYDGEYTGYYGIMTTTAVRNFQTANSMEVTGKADEATVKAIESQDAVAKEEYLTENEIIDTEWPDTDFTVGDSGTYVKRLQKYLSELGYFTGDCTGLFGTVTQTALLEFQSVNQLEPTGIADKETRALIESGEGISKAEAEAAQSVMTLSPGDTGNEVEKLQQQLNDNGYLDEEPSGYYDNATEHSVRNFQTANEIENTGIADEDTRALLNSGEGITFEEYFEMQRIIEVKNGDSGFSVVILKAELRSLGYLSTVADDVFDETTETAVKEYQKANGFTETGIADEDVRERINTDSGLSLEDAAALSRRGQKVSEIEEKTDIVLNTAYSYVGQAYSYGAVGANAYDSAGFTQFVYGKADIVLKSSAYEQGSGEGDKIEDVNELIPGDLILFTHKEDEKSTEHVGIYIGEGRYIHVSESTGVVVISQMESENNDVVFQWGKRVIR